MTTYNYSRVCNPPCPIIPIRISTILEPRTLHNKTALLDSGADKSHIPPRIARDLGIVPSGLESVLGVTGNIEGKPTYTMNIEINGRLFTDHILIEFIDVDFLLIGRDIMNELHICLDGVNLNVEIQETISE